MLYCYSYPEEEAERSHRLFPVTQQGCDEPEPRHVLLTPDTELSVTRCVLKSSVRQSQLTGCGNMGGRVAGFCLSAEQRAGGVCLLVRRVSALGCLSYLTSEHLLQLRQLGSDRNAQEVCWYSSCLGSPGCLRLCSEESLPPGCCSLGKASGPGNFSLSSCSCLRGVFDRSTDVK